MTADEEKELLYLVRDNNRMLKEIIEYINLKGSQANNENIDDFIRNIIANLISTSAETRNLSINNFNRF